MVDGTEKIISPSALWLRDVIADKQQHSAVKRASTLEEFGSNWYVASLLAKLRTPVNVQLITSIWGAATAKGDCEGSLAFHARKHGIHERHWRKLTSTRDRQEAARQTRRIVRQLPEVPIEDIIEKLFYWGPRARQDWAIAWFDYDEKGSNES